MLAVALLGPQLDRRENGHEAGRSVAIYLLLVVQGSRHPFKGVPRYSSRKASIGWMRMPCRAGPTTAITPIVIISKTTSGSSIAR